jgi:DNA polymerase III epsilon subunit-like protein
VVVGHSAQNDLAALRWVHTCVVDSFLLEVGERRREEEQAKEREGENDLKGVDSEGVSTREEKGGEAANEGGKAEDGKAGRLSLSLKDLALRKLGREIQTRGRKGHDSLEDAVTSRDLVHRHIENLIKPLQG